MLLHTHWLVACKEYGQSLTNLVKVPGSSQVSYHSADIYITLLPTRSSMKSRPVALDAVSSLFLLNAVSKNSHEHSGPAMLAVVTC